MRTLALVTVVVGAAIAHAEDGNAIRLGYRAGATVECSALSARPVGARWRVTMTLVVSTLDDHASDRTVMLEVPRGVVVTGLAVTIAGIRTSARALDAQPAAAAYRDAIEDRSDPALLELMTSAPELDRMRLRVFPVVHDRPAIVELEMSAVRPPAFEDRFGRIVATVLPPDGSPPPPAIHVDARMSLVTARAPSRSVAVQRVVWGCQPDI